MDIDFTLFRQVIDNLNDERNVSARFYDKAVKTAEVTANGLPIFKNVTYVEIRLKDNSTEVFNQPATKEKISRFAKEYALYKLAKEQIKKGTPLDQFAFLTAAELETCKNRGIFTVEALAELSDDKVQTLGLQNEHKLAEIFINNSKNNKNIAEIAKLKSKYETEIEKLSEENNILKQQIKDLNRSKKLKSKGEK